MNYYHTNEEIDEIGEGIVRKFDFDSYTGCKAIDIEKFITEYLKYRIVYENIAERDAGKTAFLADGKTVLTVWCKGNRVKVKPPAHTIVIDAHFKKENMRNSFRFQLAHEAGHIIMNKLYGEAVAAAYSNQYDNERTYSISELQEMFSIKETQATSMGVALLMPKNIVIWLLQQLKGQKHITVYGNSVFMSNDRAIIHKMAEHFQVSFISMFYRLRSLRLFEYKLLDEYLTINLDENGGDHS